MAKRRPSPNCVHCGYDKATHTKGWPNTCDEFSAEYQPVIRLHRRAEAPVSGSRQAWTTYDPAQDSVWLEFPDETWTVAYRLYYIHGDLVTAEVRMFPTDPPGVYVTGPGEWSFDPSVVPAPGLRACIARDRIKPGRVRDETKRVLADIRSKIGTERYDEIFTERGIPANIAERLSLRPLPHFTVDQRLALTAHLYLQALHQGIKGPRVEAAKKMNCTVPQVRDDLSEARRRKILERPPGQGIAGGRLTKKGRRILSTIPDYPTKGTDE